MLIQGHITSEGQAQCPTAGKLSCLSATPDNMFFSISFFVCFKQSQGLKTVWAIKSSTMFHFQYLIQISSHQMTDISLNVKVEMLYTEQAAYFPLER